MNPEHKNANEINNEYNYKKNLAESSEQTLLRV